MSAERDAYNFFRHGVAAEPPPEWDAATKKALAEAEAQIVKCFPHLYARADDAWKERGL